MTALEIVSLCALALNQFFTIRLCNRIEKLEMAYNYLTNKHNMLADLVCNSLEKMPKKVGLPFKIDINSRCKKIREVDENN